MNITLILKIAEGIITSLPNIIAKFNELKDDDGKIDGNDIIKLILFSISLLLNKF